MVKQTTAIQETLAKLLREKVFPRTTVRVISPKEIAIPRATFLVELTTVASLQVADSYFVLVGISVGFFAQE